MRRPGTSLERSVCHVAGTSRDAHDSDASGTFHWRSIGDAGGTSLTRFPSSFLFPYFSFRLMFRLKKCNLIHSLFYYNEIIAKFITHSIINADAIAIFNKQPFSAS